MHDIYHVQYLEMLTKKQNENIADNGPLRAQYPSQWGALADKGYIGVDGERLFVPFKGRHLTQAQSNHNAAVNHDRVIIENFNGRLKMKFRMLRKTCVYDQGKLNDYMDACVALTNFDIQKRPLNSQDHVHNRRITNYHRNYNTAKRQRRLAYLRERQRLERERRTTVVTIPLH